LQIANWRGEERDVSEVGVGFEMLDLHAETVRGLVAARERLEALENHEDPRVVIAATAELRHQRVDACRTLEIALKADALREFLTVVMDALAEAGVVVRRRVMARVDKAMRGDKAMQHAKCKMQNERRAE
jgi:hypothetical protein